ncbi:MAG: alpha/beta hydrolase [Patescibacteria group bacterium]
MKSIFVLVLIAFALGIVPKTNAAEVILVGGSMDAPPDLVVKAEKTLGATFVELRKLWPLSRAAKDVVQQLKEKGINMENGIVLVGYSWGGLVARQLDVDNPGLVKSVITIGSASGGYRFMPAGYFMPKDSESRTPLYVIGGYDSRIPKKWFMNGTSEENDGIVSLESVFMIGRSAMAKVTFSGFDHFGLMKSQEVTEQISEWIMRESSEKVLFAATE